MHRTYLVSILLAVLAIVIAGCGYNIKHTPAVERVALGRIQNLTSEPGVQDTLTEALREALLKDGIRVDQNAAHTLAGSITTLDLTSTAEKDDLSIQYEVKISGEFYLSGPGGKRTELRSRGAYIVTFSSEGALRSIVARKQTAINKALADLAEEIAISVSYIK